MDDSASHPLTRGAIDIVFGSPKWWGMLSVGLLLLAIVALPAAYLFGGNFGPLSGGASTPDAHGGNSHPSILAIAFVGLLGMAAVVVFVMLCIIRSYYRLMYGSAYHGR